MIKIAYIVSTLKRSGPINVLYNVIKYLDKSKYKIYVISLSPESDNSLEEEFIKLGCNIINLELSRFKGFIQAKKLINKVLRKNDIEIIHSHGIRADYIASKFEKNIVTVSTLHNYPFYDYTMTYGYLKGSIMAFMHLIFLKKINYPVVCSKSVSEILKQKNNYEIAYIQNGVDIEKYRIISEKDSIRNKLDLPLDKKIYISVGHLSMRKDPLTLIKAFKSACIKDSILIFLGKGNLKDECLKYIGESSNIKIIGFVENVIEYLQASDYFISTSKAEGLPNTVMEAMACGLPSILSDIEPHKEILEFNNLAGLTFEVGNEEDLNIKFNKIQEYYYSEISYSARKLIEENFNAETMSQKYEDIYENVKVDL